YDRAIQLNEKAYWPIKLRGLARWSLGQFDKALADFERCGELGPKDHYTPILRYFAACRVGDAAAAKRVLAAKVETLDLEWPRPVAQFLLGSLDEAGLMKLATNNDKLTEAHCYLGLENVRLGQADAARPHFQWVVDNGTPTFIEVGIARSE